MYIVRSYTTFMYLCHTDSIKVVLSSVPFDNYFGKLGRLAWPIQNLLYNYNYPIRYQANSNRCYPPDTDPHNNKYTYMPIGASIHNARYIHDFENHSNYINLLTWYLNANS